MFEGTFFPQLPELRAKAVRSTGGGPDFPCGEARQNDLHALVSSFPNAMAPEIKEGHDPAKATMTLFLANSLKTLETLPFNREIHIGNHPGACAKASYHESEPWRESAEHKVTDCFGRVSGVFPGRRCHPAFSASSKTETR